MPRFSTNSYTIYCGGYKAHAFTVGFGAPVITSAVRNDDGSPGARVKWNTTIPPECITSVTVISQYSSNHYTPPTIMQTDEATLSGLLCNTVYNFLVRVYHLHSGIRIAVGSNTVPVHVGGMYIYIANMLQGCRQGVLKLPPTSMIMFVG